MYQPRFEATIISPLHIKAGFLKKILVSASLLLTTVSFTILQRHFNRPEDNAFFYSQAIRRASTIFSVVY
jgi:hypothetical protein